MTENNPTIEEIEESIPEERKKMSFGGDGEDIIDVMEQSEVAMHKQGRHPENEHDTCPMCNKHTDTDN